MLMYNEVIYDYNKCSMYACALANSVSTSDASVLSQLSSVDSTLYSSMPRPKFILGDKIETSFYRYVSAHTANQIQSKLLPLRKKGDIRCYFQWLIEYKIA